MKRFIYVLVALLSFSSLIHSQSPIPSGYHSDGVLFDDAQTPNVESAWLSSYRTLYGVIKYDRSLGKFRVLENGVWRDMFSTSGSSTAASTTYDNTNSGLSAGNVKAALDELDADLTTATTMSGSPIGNVAEGDANAVSGDTVNAFYNSKHLNLTNIIDGGNMVDVSEWSVSNGVITQNGNSVDLTATPTTSTKVFRYLENISVDGTEDFYVLIDVTNNTSDNLTYAVAFASGANTAFKSSNFTIARGSNIICVPVNRDAYTYTGNTQVFINSSTNVDFDLTFNTVMVLDSNVSDVSSSEELINYYNQVGFFTSFQFKEYAKTALNPESSSESSPPIIYECYATGTSTAQEELDGTFRGVIGNVNAIQRAINQVPDDTKLKYELRCYGDFEATNFTDMSATDSNSGTYLPYISLTGKQNIKIVGAGNKKTVISCILPNTGSSDYQYYENIKMDCIDCELENLQIIGENVRYPVHTDTTGGTNFNENSTLTFTNCHFWHKGNTGDALTQWSSFSSYGFGISNGMTMIFNNCRFTSKDNSGLGGHDGYAEENSVIILNNCFFDTWEHPSNMFFTFNLFGDNNSKFKLVLNNNNFGNCKTLNFSKNSNNDEFYGSITGSGNSKLVFATIHTDNYYPELTDVLTHLVNTEGSTLPQYSLVDKDGSLSTGSIEYVCIDNPLDGDMFRAVKNTLIDLSTIPIKTGETIVSGNYVAADNGELIYSATPTNAIIITHNSTDYLEL